MSGLASNQKFWEEEAFNVPHGNHTTGEVRAWASRMSLLHRQPFSLGYFQAEYGRIPDRQWFPERAEFDSPDILHLSFFYYLQVCGFFCWVVLIIVSLWPDRLFRFVYFSLSGLRHFLILKTDSVPPAAFRSWGRADRNREPF